MYLSACNRWLTIAERDLRAMKFEPSSVEELLGSPLSRYIKLATNTGTLRMTAITLGAQLNSSATTSALGF